MSLKRLTIRNQLFLLISIVVLITLLLTSSIIYYYSLKNYKKQLVEEMMSLAQMIGINNQSAIAFDDQATANEILSTLRENEKVKLACLLTKNRKIFADYVHDEKPQSINIPGKLRGEYLYHKNELEILKDIYFDGEQIATIYMSISLDSMKAQLKRLQGFLLLFFIITYLFSILSIFFISGYITKPILHLAKITSEISAQKNYSLRAAKMEEKTEIGILYNGFNEMLNVIEMQNNEILIAFKEISEQKDKILKQKDQIDEQRNILALWNKDISSSISYASNIQRNMLLPPNKIKNLYPNVMLYFEPRDVVSGDFYWFEKENGCLLFSAVDCTGHGVPGAMISVIGFNLLNQIVKGQKVRQPNLILDYLDTEIRNFFHKDYDDYISDDGMDISICCFNIETKTLHFAGANNGAIIIRDKDVFELLPDKHPLGSGKVRKDQPYTLQTFDLKQNDSVYLFSDGYADQFGGSKGKKMMKKYFKELLVEISNMPFEKRLDELKMRFEEWKGDLEQVDDLLIIGLKVD